MPPTGHLHAARAAGRRLITLPLCCQPTQRDPVCSRQLCACTSFRARSALGASLCTGASTREAALSQPTDSRHLPSPELRLGQVVQAQVGRLTRSGPESDQCHSPAGRRHSLGMQLLCIPAAGFLHLLLIGHAHHEWHCKPLSSSSLTSAALDCCSCCLGDAVCNARTEDGCNA